MLPVFVSIEKKGKMSASAFQDTFLGHSRSSDILAIRFIVSVRPVSAMTGGIECHEAP